MPADDQPEMISFELNPRGEEDVGQSVVHSLAPSSRVQELSAELAHEPVQCPTAADGGDDNDDDDNDDAAADHDDVVAEEVVPVATTVPSPAPTAPSPAPTALTASAGTKVQFNLWFHSLFQVLMDFAIMSCSTAHGKSEKALLRLRETIQRLRALAEGMELEKPTHFSVTTTLERVLRTLPTTVSQMLALIFKRVGEMNVERLQAEEQWTHEWAQLHLQVLATYFHVANWKHRTCSAHLSAVDSTMAVWAQEHGQIARMLAPRREKLLQRAQSLTDAWLGFCLKYTQALRETREHAAVADRIMQEQQAFVGGAAHDSSSGGGDGAAGALLNVHLSLAIQSFLDQSATHAPPSQHPELWEMKRQRREQQMEEHERHMTSLRALEEGMLRNRQEKHRIWMTMQHQQLASSALQRIQALDDEYAEHERESVLLYTLLRQTATAAPGQGDDGDATTTTTTTPSVASGASSVPIAAFAQQALRFLPLAQRLERDVLCYTSLAKQLERTVYDVHDDFIKNEMTSVCAYLKQVRHKLLSELCAKIELKSTQRQQQARRLRDDMATLLRQAAEQCHGHTTALQTLLQVHGAILENDERHAKYKAREATLAMMRTFLQTDTNLQQLLQRHGETLAASD